jgi:hypothetical protein
MKLIGIFLDNHEEKPDSDSVPGRLPESSDSDQRPERKGEEQERKGKDDTHTHKQKVDESKIDPELLPHWKRWCEWFLIANSVEIDAIQAEEVLMNLGRRGTQKAIKDIGFSIFKGAKSILDSDNDFQKRNRPVATKQRVELQ